MTIHTDDTSEEAINAARDQKFASTARRLIKDLRQGDRLLGSTGEKATPTHMRPSTKRGKTVRRDPSFNLADQLMDLEDALDKADWTNARVIYYQVRKSMG